MSNNYFVVIDYGSYEIRLKIYDDKNKEIFATSSKEFLNENIFENSDLLNILIRKSEKKISSHIENVLVLYDDKDTYCVDLSIKKKFVESIDINKYLANILEEAQSLVYSNYKDTVILHSINQMIIVDGKEYYRFENVDISGKDIILSYKFLCLSKKKYQAIEDIFVNNNLNVVNIYSSSFIKSINYKEVFNKNDLTVCLDVGWEKSTLICYDKEYLKFFGNIKLGGNHFTKDISKLLKINSLTAEKIKISFRSLTFDTETNLLEVEKQNFIKKIVVARMSEIFHLSFKDLYFLKRPSISNINLFLTGNGSKVFSHLTNEIDTDLKFSIIKKYDKPLIDECITAKILYFKNKNDNLNSLEKMNKKKGFFENFFNFFNN